MRGSCVGCKFLYGNGQGYSDWTWLDTSVTCAKDKNPNLPAEEPFDWNRENDNWPQTMNSRCELFSAGPYITISPDGNPSEDPIDEEQREAFGDYVEWDSSTGEKGND